MEGVGDAICNLFNEICCMGVWPSWFNDSISIIIPKSNKPDYKIPKAYYCPIALLNTIGKLLTKIITNRMQYEAVAFSLLHEGQCGGVQKHATIAAAGSILPDLEGFSVTDWSEDFELMRELPFGGSLTRTVL